MQYPKSRNIHRPPHILVDKTNYFITTRTFNRVGFLKSNDRKIIFLNVLNEFVKRFNVKLIAWVILDNHYHLLMWIEHGRHLPRFIQNLHANTSRLLNTLDDTPGRRIWHQYQDHGIRDERDYYIHLNYTHHNPVKHGYAKAMNDYQFSSYNHWFKQKGREWLDSCFRQYPIKDFMTQNYEK